MDLETEVKLRFLSHKDPRAWDLEKSVIQEPPKPHFTCKYDVVYYGI